MGPRKKKLMELKASLEELKHFNDQGSAYATESRNIGKQFDQRDNALTQALRRVKQATDDLQNAAREHQEALDADRKVSEAFLNNTDTSAESWLEDELAEAAKVTLVKAKKHRAAKEALDQATKERDAAQAEYQKWDKIWDDNYKLSVKNNKEAEDIEREIKALEKDLKDNPSIGRKIKNLLK